MAYPRIMANDSSLEKYAAPGSTVTVSFPAEQRDIFERFCWQNEILQSLKPTHIEANKNNHNHKDSTFNYKIKLNIQQDK